MDNFEDIRWDDIKNKLKEWKIKGRRALHRFDRKTGLSKFSKRLLVLAALKVITAVSPASLAQAQEAQIRKSSDPYPTRSELLAFNKQIKNDMSFEDFMAQNQARMSEREQRFAKDLWETLVENVEEVKYAKEHGLKTQTLRSLFGKDVHPRYYCAISGLKSLEQTIQNKDYPEYKFLLNCIQNPHACISVIQGLKSAYGEESKTRNINKTIEEQLKENPNSVFIVVHNSTRNTSSGKHFVFVLPNKIVVDSLVSEKETLKGKVVSFNVERITNSDTYFTGSRAVGDVFNLTKMSHEDLIYLFYNDIFGIEQKMKAKEQEATPIAQAETGPRGRGRPRKNKVWHEVSTNAVLRQRDNSHQA